MKKLLLLFWGILIFTIGISNKSNGQLITTVAGTGTAGFSADGGLGNATMIDSAYSVVVDAAGNIIFTDKKNNRIRKVTPCGIISTIAGVGMVGYYGDDGPATQAKLNNPTGITIDGIGNIYFSDAGNFRIRKIDLSGTITLVAGNGFSGFSGDGGDATNARLSLPMGLVTDVAGNLYVADKNNNRIRKISTSGTIIHFAGNVGGTSGSTGDGGAATLARLFQPEGLAIDTAGNIYIADVMNNKIRVVNKSGIINTIVGDGTAAFAGDGGSAATASLFMPTGIYVDSFNNIYITDQLNNRIRIVSSGIINSYAGTGTFGYSGDMGSATAAQLNYPIGISGSNNGDIYFSDAGNNCIRKIFNSHSPKFAYGHALHFSACQNVANSVNSILAVHDTDLGQLLTWSTQTNPTHGSVSISYSTTSTGCGINIPSGLTYTTSSGYYGLDSFKVMVSDGQMSDVATVIVTVNPLPNVGSIIGAGYICLGSSKTISETISGGTWSLTNTNAQITPYGTDSIIATGIVNGIDSIIYTVTSSTTGCVSRTSVLMPVVPYTSPITGSSSTNLCTSQTMVLKDSVGYGTWSSSNTTIATVSGYGLVTPVSVGSVTITYTQVLCGSTVYSTKDLTINISADAGTITGSSIICLSVPTTFTESATGGVWSCTNTNATVSTGGVVTPITAGIDTILYTATTGLCTSVATLSVIVAPYPGKIIGSSTLCLGSLSTLTESVSGGTWSCDNTSLATIDASSGIVTPLATGLVNITYTVNFPGCGGTTVDTFRSFRIYTPPTVPDIIHGNDTVCQAGSIKLYDTTNGGNWSRTNISGNVSISVLYGTDSILVTGLSQGTVLISYTVSSNGCGSTTTKTVNVYPLPTVNSITGSLNTCIGINPDTLICSTTGGTWTNSNSLIATFSYISDDTVVINGLNAGTTTVKYSTVNRCGIASTSKVVAVNPLPNAGTITGLSSVCQSAYDTLNETVIGGHWFHNNAYTSSLSSGISSGIPYIVLRGNSQGMDTIGYYVNSSYCGSDTAYSYLNVNPLPQHGTITGNSVVCTGTSITLTNNTYSATSVVWKSLNTDTATVSFTVDTFGIIHAVGIGKDTIRFIVHNGCGYDSTYKVITVQPTPYAGMILGDSILCKSSVETLRDTLSNLPGGNWLRTNSNASVTSLGLVTGTAPGFDTIMYRINTANCGSDTAFFTVHINALPKAGTITSTSSTLCAGANLTITGAGTGGAKKWKSSNTAVATIDSITGVVHGVHQGIDSILYIINSQHCGSDTSYYVITINPNPYAGSISASKQVICVGETDTLINPILGCVWKRINNHVSLDTNNVIPGYSTAVITGLTKGIDTIKYISTNSCGTTYSQFIVTVNPLADAGTIAVSNSTICQHDSLQCTDTVTGGIWHRSNNFVRISTSGLIKADSTGIDTIYYIKGNNCDIDTAIKVITISPEPNAGKIVGSKEICLGLKTTLTDTVTGGRWYHKNTNTSVVSTTGVITAKNVGIDTILYRYTNSCGADTVSFAIKINALPESPNFIKKPNPTLCSNTMYQVIGVDSSETKIMIFEWSATNAEIFATSKNKQNCIVNFPDAGKSIVKLTINNYYTGCTISDSTSFTIDTSIAPSTTVIYVGQEFFCLDNSASKYQWGYDVTSTKTSVTLDSEVNQNYFNPSPDFSGKNYWVITNYGKCSQKTYYNIPTGSFEVNTKGIVSMDIFPNPTNNSINVIANGITGYDKYEIKLFDMTGKELINQNLINGSGILNLSNLANGLYMVSLNMNGLKIITKTIIKN